ncbi:glycosyltransferase [Halomarina litorea]|uniref:glycosyltransferase n=1 Tax=Halomarina litorea TaxID=2961595 RepID=UPI0020C3762B|nr:glycosyltransferase family 2 protein [Halomarina sp. BCD28]
MATTDITLAIPCYNAVDSIGRVFDAVDDLTVRPDAVLCVDGESDDGTREVVRDHPTARLVRQEDHGGTGVADARNVALSLTETSLVGFLDADAAPHPEWLETLTRVLDEKDVAAAGGLPVEVVTTRADRWRKWHLGLNFGDHRGYVHGIAGNNGLFRTAALRDVGGWRTDVGASEDLELCERLVAADYDIYYTSDAVVDHIRTDTPESVLDTVWNYHFTGGDEPTSAASLLPRFLLHGGKCAKYVLWDVENRNWGIIPVTLRLPLVHARRDIRHLRGK